MGKVDERRWWWYAIIFLLFILALCGSCATYVVLDSTDRIVCAGSERICNEYADSTDIILNINLLKPVKQ